MKKKKAETVKVRVGNAEDVRNFRERMWEQILNMYKADALTLENAIKGLYNNEEACRLMAEGEGDPEEALAYAYGFIEAKLSGKYEGKDPIVKDFSEDWQRVRKQLTDEQEHVIKPIFFSFFLTGALWSAENEKARKDVLSLSDLLLNNLDKL